MKNNQKGRNNNRNYNNNRKGNTRNNNNAGGKSPFDRAAAEMRAAKRQEILGRQNHNLDVLEMVEQYLSERISYEWEKMSEDREPNKPIKRPDRIKMQDVIAALDPEYKSEDTIPVSQFTQILIELANAQLDTRIDISRIQIRIEYYRERLKTVFTDNTLQERIDNLTSAHKYILMTQTEESEEHSADTAETNEVPEYNRAPAEDVTGNDLKDPGVIDPEAVYPNTDCDCDSENPEN